MEKLTIRDVKLDGKRCLMRVDFNVPLDKQTHEVTDDNRIRGALPTIQYAIDNGAKVILMSHLGRPKGERKPEFSLKPVADRLTELLGQKVIFVENLIGEDVTQAVNELQNGQVLLLENTRFEKGEKKNDPELSKQLAELGDVHVNDAFGTAHRAHASTYTIAKYFPKNSMLGYLVENEISNIDKVVKKGKRPFTAILGGSKVSTKIHIIEALIEKVDNLIIGGGIAYTFSKAMGGKIGDSLVENDYIDVAKNIIIKAKEKNINLYLPTDCIIADDFKNDANIEHCEINQIKDGWMGLDAGIKSTNKFTEVIESSATILWNGPVGVFEMSNFSIGTLKIAMAVARATDKGAFSLIGGGDSISAVNKFSLAHKISYISTAGGALLEYIEGKQLPALKAIVEDI